MEQLKKNVEIAKTELAAKKKRFDIDDSEVNRFALKIAKDELKQAIKELDEAKEAAEEGFKKQKASEKEELNELQRYEQFCNARDAMARYNFAFQRRNGEYFITKVFVDKDKHDSDIERHTTELESYGYELLGKAFIELEHPVAKKFLRRMVEGTSFTVPTGDGEYETWEGPRRIYHKLVNTIHVPDPDTYNIINLDNIVKPTGIETECPWALKSLFKALGAGKEENIEHIEKFIYSTCVADIGNNQTPFPVFYGKGKVGKNALFELVIPGIIGKESVFTGTWSLVGESNFNQFKLGKVLIFIDEIPERSEWTKVKNWTGSTTEYIKVKYGPEYLIDNVTALAFGSNETTFPLPWEDGEQMQRVSPMKVGNTTFAEYIVKDANALYGDTFIADALMARIGEVPESIHMQGDKFLRNFKAEWCGKDVIQQLVNYLDTKYNPGEGKRFALQPLRGTDWDDLTHEKKDYVYRALDWCIDKKMDYIIVDEAYAVFEHMNKVSKKDIYKKVEGFGKMAAIYLKEKGWVPKDQVYVEYVNTLAQQVKDKGTKITASRRKVYFRNDDAVVGTVQSLYDTYFKEVAGSQNNQKILNDSI